MQEKSLGRHLAQLVNSLYELFANALFIYEIVSMQFSKIVLLGCMTLKGLISFALCEIQ